MDLSKILGGIAILLVLYFIYVLLKYFKFFQNIHLTGLEKAIGSDGTSETRVDVGSDEWAPDSIPTPNYTISIWFYVTSWDVRYNDDKYILTREYAGTTNDIEVYLDKTQK